jgi:hypothetical protein
VAGPLRRVAGWLAVAGVVAGGAVFSHGLLASADGGLARVVGWALAAALCVLVYFAATWRPTSRRWPRRACWR